MKENQNFGLRTMKRLSQYFFHGLLVIVPLALTLYVCYVIFIKIDRLMGLKQPGLGVLITVVGITMVGFFASNFLTRNLFSLLDQLFTKLPFVKMLYSAIRDLVYAFVGDKKSFNQPVLVNLFPGSEARVMGFLTREGLANLGMEQSVAVYIPQAYTFAGYLVIVPRDQISPLKIESSKAMAFIVSGGVSLK